MRSIKGCGLIIRKLDLEKDLESFYRLHSNTEVIKFYGMSPLRTTDEAAVMLAGYIESEQKEKSIHYVIGLETIGEYIGEIGLFNINLQHKRANAYCILSPDYWGRRISKKATLLLFPYIFANTSINRIQAFVDSRNVSTIQSLIKIGYRNEGVLSEYEFENDSFIDIAVFSMTKSHFQKLHPN